MDWRRFKNIIIIVLVVINVFFAAFLIRLKILDYNTEKETQNNVISVLKKSNIIIEKDDFPKNRGSYLACYVTRFLPTDTGFINGIIGKDGKYSSKDDETMTFEIKPKGKQELSEGEIISACQAFMEKHNIEAELYSYDEVDISSKQGKVKFYLEYDGDKFFDSYIEFSLNHSGIYKITGKNIIKAEESISSYKAELLPVEGILVSAANDKKTKKTVSVKDITFGYYLGNSAGVYVSVLSLPVWEIEFSDGDKLYYDARNGNLINVK